MPVIGFLNSQSPERFVEPMRGFREEMDAIAITRAKFHGEWNYTISPNNRSDRAVDP
jgi:hypothetical protein